MSIFKVVQKRIYDVLSEKHSILMCFFGIVIILVSAFHFGEIALEWSAEKYQSVFNSFSDNIAQKSFQNQLCQHVPIDVVYTWVNGTDKRMLAKLIKARRELEVVLNISDVSRCTYSHCVQSHLVLVSPTLSRSVTLDDLEDINKVFENVTGMFVIETKLKDKNCNFTVLIFSSVKSAVQAVTKEMFHLSGANYSMRSAFLTNDWMADNAVQLKGIYIMTGIPHGYTSDDIKQNLPFPVEKIFLYEDNMAVLTTNAQLQSDTMNITINNKPTKMSPSYIVVEPLVEIEDASASRFADNEELKYSLRSLEKNAPWVRHIYLVTNGQIPYWLNMENSRMSVVTHEDIFLNKSHLPTFSSPAIEAHLHRIKGLSKKFLYLNDDVMFGAPVWPDDFHTHSKGHKIYLSWPVPDCAEGCPTTWIKDGYCDKPCNNSHCQWDGGDCIGENVKLTYGHHSGSPHFSGNVIDSLEKLYCNPTCSDSWLSDRYCDQSCNVKNCAFDAGDCGTESYWQLHQLQLKTDRTKYILPKGETLAFFNLTSFMAEEGPITLGDYENSPLIRTMAVSIKYKVLTIILHSGYNETCVNVSLKGNSDLNKFEFSFLADTRPFKIVKERAVGNTTSYLKSIFVRSRNVTTTSVLERFPQNKWYPHTYKTEATVDTYYVNASASDLPLIIQSRVKDLEALLHSGWITEKGFQKRRSMLISEYLAQNLGNGTSIQFLVFKSNFSSDSLLTKENFSIVNNSHLQFQRKLQGYYGFLPWEKLGTYNYIQKLLKAQSKKLFYETGKMNSRHLMDTYGDSLLHVNKLYNAAFGYEARKVPAHMAHLVDVDVAKRLHDRFSEEFDRTSAHKIRSASDMQFAFSYYYYLMHEEEEYSLDEIFDQIDTDHSKTWSDREIRTLLTQLNDLPLKLASIVEFEEMIVNCSKNVLLTNSDNIIVPPDERYYDSNLPTVTKELVLQCKPISKKLKEKFSLKKTNRFETIGEEEVAFKMIHSNLSIVIGNLDDIRKHPKKFICLNDNLRHDSKDSEMVKAVLRDFYESLFPIPSQFELPAEYRNKFLYMDELKQWRRCATSVQNSHGYIESFVGEKGSNFFKFSFCIRTTITISKNTVDEDLFLLIDKCRQVHDNIKFKFPTWCCHLR